MRTQLKPGDAILVPSEADPAVRVPATVEQVRWQHTRNGEQAIAVCLEYTDVITSRVLVLEIESGEYEYACEGADVPLAECPSGQTTELRAFYAQGIEMADPQLVAEVQERLRIQREHMRATIAQTVAAPGIGRSSTTASKLRAKERAKEKRDAEKTALANAIAEIKAELGCSDVEATAELKRRAGI